MLLVALYSFVNKDFYPILLYSVYKMINKSIYSKADVGKQRRTTINRYVRVILSIYCYFFVIILCFHFIIFVYFFSKFLLGVCVYFWCKHFGPFTENLNPQFVRIILLVLGCINTPKEIHSYLQQVCSSYSDLRKSKQSYQ